ncbi:MAG: tRNA epoxyqueuosine(34) reductase QueG [Rikenellaceae bacterium]|nr:tRNA epoxyqueuosine(34) reductase QueG [Rikenellaceae bacterium]
MLRYENIVKAAEKAGFDLVGVAHAAPLVDEQARYRSWLEKGYHDSLGYLHRNIEKRFDPGLLVEGAQTIIVCAVNYKSPISEGYPAGHRAKVASYACNRDYHTTLKEMLRQLFKELKEQCPGLAGRAFVDSAPVAEKRWAVEAGLGWIGRQSLLVTPQYGTFVHLGELILNEVCDSYDTPFAESRCGNCRACIESCPTGAIGEERTIDASRCIACHTIEQQPDNAIDLNGWIFGCEACQHCCPYNRHAPHHRNRAFDPVIDPREMTPEMWLAMSRTEFETRLGETPMTRSGLARIRANVKR